MWIGEALVVTTRVELPLPGPETASTAVRVAF